MKKIFLFIFCPFILVSIFSFDDDEEQKVVEFEKFGLKVYNSIIENNFKDFYKLFITRNELNDFLTDATVDKDRIKLRVEEYDTFKTKAVLEYKFNTFQKCPNNEGVYWEETSLKNQVKKFLYAPVRATNRIVVQSKNKEYVIFCTEVYKTKNGWKLNEMPTCLSIQAQKEQFKTWQKEGESER